MNLRSIKHRSELVLDGITFDAEYHNSTLKTLTMTDASGHLVKVDVEFSSLKALVPAEPEKKEVHVVTGTVPVLGTAINEAFESEYEAGKRLRELERASVIENGEVKTGEVEIPF